MQVWQDARWRTHALGTLAEFGGPQPWLKDLLVSIVIALEGGEALRYTALDALRDVWAKEHTADKARRRDAAQVKGMAEDDLPWLRTLLIQLSTSPKENVRIRTVSLWALYNVRERKDWTNTVLQPRATPKEENGSVREMAIVQMSKF